MKEKNVARLGWIASCLAIAMYLSYIDQIVLNISGAKGSIALPVVTTINCLVWVFYGWFKAKKDWPIIVCSIPGIVLGLVAAITAL